VREDLQRWSDNYATRELLAVELMGGDVSLVSRGANPEATAEVACSLADARAEPFALESIRESLH